MIDAVDPIKIDPTSMSDTCKVFDNVHMQWMCIWMCPYNITAALIDQALGSHLANCYDWIAYAMASLILQSFGVESAAVSAMLETIQEMKFFL